MARRFIQTGDECDLRPTEVIGWVSGCVSYADARGDSFIVDTEKHGRFSFSDPEHADLRWKKK